MKLSFRARIVLTLAPILGLFAALGVAGVVLLHQLGGRIDAILRENYDTVLYMERLNEALERIDSSFQFALAGKSDKAREQYEANWPVFLDNLHKEQRNITLPAEGPEVNRLIELAERYRQQGDAFHARPAGAPERSTDYFGPGGLYENFQALKRSAATILRMNQDHMEQASAQARQTARDSLYGFGLGLVVAAVLAGFLAARTIRAILQPIQDVTRSALAIGAGNLDQVVPVLSADELGRLAEAFNGMARQLRTYRQSDYARLLRAQRTGQATIDSFPDPVLVVDSASQVEMANPAAMRLLGVRGREPEQEAGTAWTPPAALTTPLQDALVRQQAYLPQEFDNVIRLRCDGEELSYLPRILPVRDPFGNTLGAAVLLQDVTRFRLLDEVKSDLVATVSHELKTPLTSIRLAVHLLLEETVGPLTAKQTELLIDGRDNAERLLSMVNHLLDLAKLEQGRQRLELAPHAPADVLALAAEHVRPRAEDKGVTVTVEAAPDLPAVSVDLQRLGHAFTNLLENAVTYTEHGGKVTLAAAVIDGVVELSVSDTGCGIAPEHVPHIFDKFYRIPGQSAPAGTGLGLAIVREVVQAHAGTITCVSEPGVGTTFRIRLPIRPGGAS